MLRNSDSFGSVKMIQANQEYKTIHMWDATPLYPLVLRHGRSLGSEREDALQIWQITGIIFKSKNHRHSNRAVLQVTERGLNISQRLRKQIHCEINTQCLGVGCVLHWFIYSQNHELHCDILEYQIIQDMERINSKNRNEISVSPSTV